MPTDLPTDLPTDVLVLDIAWPELPRDLASPEELADLLDASLWQRAGIAFVDENRLELRVHHPEDVEAFAADLADRLSLLGMPDRTYLSWRDELGVHRRSVTGRRVATARRRVGRVA
ncbi:conserved hypothetical protein [Frankia canadensis]|uniref:Uncharacterized protein n=1 Tax=Frankia canadensis TaxID=1836972 RepID=A0A2I2KUB9_9ACTN|nr:hypothetical protein [Frankia canadensis]SNQ49264.1 conserved hypothetical protein [Frankia canadensis]SOU56554.1 conserved hypothetical protein [Frankia canadensis]